MLHLRKAVHSPRWSASHLAQKSFAILKRWNAALNKTQDGEITKTRQTEQARNEIPTPTPLSENKKPNHLLYTQTNNNHVAEQNYELSNKFPPIQKSVVSKYFTIHF